VHGDLIFKKARTTYSRLFHFVPEESPASSFRGVREVIRYRCHYVKATVRVYCYSDASLAILHGPRKLADYDAEGRFKQDHIQTIA
jgi:hypothetical protein